MFYNPNNNSTVQTLSVPISSDKRGYTVSQILTLFKDKMQKGGVNTAY